MLCCSGLGRKCPYLLSSCFRSCLWCLFLLIMFSPSVGSRPATGHSDVVIDNWTLSTVEDYEYVVILSRWTLALGDYTLHLKKKGRREGLTVVCLIILFIMFSTFSHWACRLLGWYLTRFIALKKLQYLLCFSTVSFEDFFMNHLNTLYLLSISIINTEHRFSACLIIHYMKATNCKPAVFSVCVKVLFSYFQAIPKLLMCEP